MASYGNFDCGVRTMNGNDNNDEIYARYHGIRAQFNAPPRGGKDAYNNNQPLTLHTAAVSGTTSLPTIDINTRQATPHDTTPFPPTTFSPRKTCTAAREEGSWPARPSTRRSGRRRSTPCPSRTEIFALETAARHHKEGGISNEPSRIGTLLRYGLSPILSPILFPILSTIQKVTLTGYRMIWILILVFDSSADVMVLCTPK